MLCKPGNAPGVEHPNLISGCNRPPSAPLRQALFPEIFQKIQAEGLAPSDNPISSPTRSGRRSPRRPARVEPTREQSFLRRTAEIEQHNAKLRAENAELRAQNANLLEQNAQLTAKVANLTEQVARLSKNSSNSSKPPSSNIVKPPKAKNPKGPCHQGGQLGHRGVNRSPFRPDQIHHVEELHPTRCPSWARRRTRTDRANQGPAGCRAARGSA